MSGLRKSLGSLGEMTWGFTTNTCAPNVEDTLQQLKRSFLKKGSVMSVSKMPKEKVRLYSEKQGLSVRGSTWTLWFRKVRTNDGKTMYLFKPLELRYSEKTKQFYYEEIRGPIWLEKEDVDKLIGALIELTEED